jgi:hypothetical protein
MNTINTTLRFTSKPNIDGIRQTILKGNTSYNTSTVESKGINGQIISFVLKNHTNYMSVCKRLWTQPKQQVAQELKNFYLCIIKMDNTLVDQAKYGFIRHMSMYNQNYARNIRG